MQRRVVPVLLAVITVLSAALWAQRVSSEATARDSVEEIRALEKTFSEVIFRGDVSTFDRMTSDDYTVISENGDLHSKRETLEWLARRKAEYRYIQKEDLNVRVYGDAAVVTGRSVLTRQQHDRDFNGAYRFTEVYIRQNGRWLAVALQVTRRTEEQ
ncbi:MAG TPA: nuclear transport factor 2 family protein [Steroidobacteraceae bacterium]|nr:nuclear transport factor 2 family protein [Steroidobacteraceae bacterium]